jgi:hypothetical protein
MKQTFTVSSIAKQTGLDRRTIDRALIDVQPVETSTTGGRASMQYDRDDVTAALAEAGAPREQVARLMPFGGSVTRLVAWNTCVQLVKDQQRALAMDRATWPKRFGVTPEQADRLGARAAVVAMAMADHLLANYGDRCPETTCIDDGLAGCDVPAREAKPGAFAEVLDLSDNEVRAMMQAAIDAEAVRA